MNHSENAPMFPHDARWFNQISNLTFAAMNDAVSQAVNRHQRLGEAVAIWDQGGIAILHPDGHRIPLPPTPHTL